MFYSPRLRHGLFEEKSLLDGPEIFCGYYAVKYDDSPFLFDQTLKYFTIYIPSNVVSD